MTYPLQYLSSHKVASACLIFFMKLLTVQITAFSLFIFALYRGGGRLDSGELHCRLLVGMRLGRYLCTPLLSTTMFGSLGAK